MKKIFVGILVIIIGLGSLFAYHKTDITKSLGTDHYKILKKWELPPVLDEISGIAYLGNKRIACVQDEDGIIYIYNLNSSTIEQEIPFAKDGDYEGITVVNQDAYVLRSDGIIFEVKSFRSQNPKVTKLTTAPNRLPGINIEGLCADTENNRLLLAVKERENSAYHKEIYAYNLTNMETVKDPLFLIDLSSPIFENLNDFLEDKFSPGEIAIHPHSGEYYILDGSKPKILITDSQGSHKELYILDPADFGNPEGLTFTPEGDLFISNEAEDEPANILQVSLKRESK
ncbi:SdiA-regulated domain-containing protein [Salinimicrobium sp. GXAS 041]|uniref:SdiA-regulated domain-containing protein n=1 Tax=Salinimicrobium sp. GXAS 041 TaxID=3400806 RepID=UPI003C727840